MAKVTKKDISSKNDVVASDNAYIEIKGAKVNNLKNVSLKLPRFNLIVFTGLSGSGKSSLAFDTLYAEGQRRYIESLSSYARQFLGKLQKPAVESITGISPAIAIEQKTISSNPRSTVGTSTEIYEYLKLLFARIGKTYSPISGKEVKRHKTSDVIDKIKEAPENSTFFLTSPIILPENRSLADQLKIFTQQGYTRLVYQNNIIKIQDLISDTNKIDLNKNYFLLIDRFVYNSENEDDLLRIADSVQTAFSEGKGACVLKKIDGENFEDYYFSNLFEEDNMSFEILTPQFFSFNNPYGACKKCNGFGSIIGIDEDLVIPNRNLSLFEDAVACWRGEKMSEFKNLLIQKAHLFDFPVHKPINELTELQYKLLWNGNEHFIGINDFFAHIETKTYKIQYRVMLARYRGKTVCPDCNGTKIRKDASYVKIAGKNISELLLLPLDELLLFFNNLKLDEYDTKISQLLLKEIKNRVSLLCQIGLPYLNLNRLSRTLSGGESQRINIATSLGSALIGSMYILDEPSIGLHPRDTRQLISVLQNLRDIGNTVIVVEHEEDIIKEADFIVDIGPEAGINGGNIVFAGTPAELKNEKKSITAQYLNDIKQIPIPTSRRKWKDHINIIGANENNLKNIDVKIPLNIFTVITGVSGSGKTTLIKQILFPALRKIYSGSNEKIGKVEKISGDIKRISQIEIIDQNPLGRSSRSNPATFVKAFDEIRQLFSIQKLAKTRGYTPGYFSFNIAGGRCEECEGNGFITIGMQFMADVNLVCESCNGKKYSSEALEIKHNGLNISQVLDLSIDESIDFFKNSETFKDICSRIADKIQPLKDIGLGYLKLGQSSDTFSGGEAQRLKLASYLGKGKNIEPTLFIFDEPSTGLHTHDIYTLLKAFDAILKKGHSIVVIEHNPDIIKNADWIIDLGPEGGKNGGYIVFEGTPEQIVKSKESYTGIFLNKRVKF